MAACNGNIVIGMARKVGSGKGSFSGHSFTEFDRRPPRPMALTSCPDLVECFPGNRLYVELLCVRFWNVMFSLQVQSTAICIIG